MVLAIQSVNLACVAPAVFLIARHHRAPMGVAVALALATGLSFGLQSAAYFDSHEITVGFGFLAWGVWAFETGRLRAATVLLAVFALFKESLGAYVVGLGLLAGWRGLTGAGRRWWVYGLGWIVGGAVWFVLVNRVFMPALIARGRPPEPHETFGDFGPTVFLALIGIVTQPLKAFGALFVPGDKLWSHVTTFGGLGWLSLLAPQVGLAALPLFAERFLSSKATMWQMGYHYAAPLSLYAGWAAARGYQRATRLAAAGLARAWAGRRLGRRGAGGPRGVPAGGRGGADQRVRLPSTPQTTIGGSLVYFANARAARAQPRPPSTLLARTGPFGRQTCGAEPDLAPSGRPTVHLPTGRLARRRTGCCCRWAITPGPGSDRYPESAGPNRLDRSPRMASRLTPAEGTAVFARVSVTDLVAGGPALAGAQALRRR